MIPKTESKLGPSPAPTLQLLTLASKAVLFSSLFMLVDHRILNMTCSFFLVAARSGSTRPLAGETLYPNRHTQVTTGCFVRKSTLLAWSGSCLMQRRTPQRFRQVQRFRWLRLQIALTQWRTALMRFSVSRLERFCARRSGTQTVGSPSSSTNSVGLGRSSSPATRRPAA